MSDTHKNIVLMSYEKGTEEVLKYLSEDELRSIRIVHATFDDTKKIAEKLIQNKEVSVFISAGSNAQILKDNFPYIPLAEIKVTGFDVLNAIIKAKNYSYNMFILMYKYNIEYLSDCKNMINANIIESTYQDALELKRKIHEIKDKSPNSVIIGSSLVCDLASENGMNSVLIYSSSSIKNAVRHAYQLLRVIERDAVRLKQLQAIIDFAYSGIISIDENGYITAFNKMAERIMGVKSSDTINKIITDVIPDLQLTEVLNAEASQINKIQNIENKKVIITKIPITYNNQTRGVVATFLDANMVQAQEQIIRYDAHNKGLVAKYNINDIKGSSKSMIKLKETIKNYAISPLTVLITGESGAGKELVAQSIHNLSTRRNQPFVAINCASLPENLLESELFGYEEGTFTGAVKGGKAGLFEVANGGTIFLDEIGELPLSFQSQLLRVLQEKEVRRLGGNKIIPVDVRVIVATNVNLNLEVAEKKFREDLYYRINVLRIDMPALRTHLEDIPEIAGSFMQNKYANIYYAYKNKWDLIFRLCKTCNWPGNIRQLENFLERLTADSDLLNEEQSYIEKEILNLLKSEELPAKPPEASNINNNSEKNYRGIMKEKILKELVRNNGNRKATAEAIGVSTTTLWRYMKIYNIK